MKKLQNQSGFTLIEILVVIGVLAILLAIVLIAINPRQQFSDANNTQRQSDTSAVLNAIHQYAAKNSGALPGGITATTDGIVGSDTAAGGVDLCADLVPNYIADLPIDPSTGTTDAADGQTCLDATTYSTGYNVAGSAGDRVTVSAPAAENGETISVSR